MNFMVNKAFVNYLDHLENLTDSLDVPIIMDKTNFSRDFTYIFKCLKLWFWLTNSTQGAKRLCSPVSSKKEIFDLQERHTITDSKLPNKNFLFNSFTIDVFLFITAIISLLVTTLVKYILCKHMKLQMLVTSLAL